MDLDVVLLSRIQFAFVVTFHIIFPAFTIGLAAWLATLEGVSLATGNPVYRRCSISGSRSSRSRSAWGSSRASSWRSSSAPTGACWPRRPARSRGRCSATRPLPRSSWKPRSSGSSCSGAAGCRRGSTAFPAPWSRSAPWRRRSGSSPTTAGCKCRLATRSWAARSCRATGWRSSGARSSGSAGCTCCSRPS